MRKSNLIAACALLLAAPLVAAELNPVHERGLDATHRSDQATLRDLAQRVAALPATSPVRPAAAAWLLVAQTEYDRTNRTPFVSDALARAESALASDAPSESALSVHRAWIAHRRATAGFRAALPLLRAAEGLESRANPGRPAPEIADAPSAHVTHRLHGLQTRLAALWDGGLSSESYAFARAQSWLDFAVDEHYGRDRTGNSARAADATEKFIAALERSSPADDPVPVAPTLPRRVRTDLWAKADALRPADLAARMTASEPRLAALARLEVQLVWAGLEHAQRGWRSSRPFVQLAEWHAAAAAPASAP